MTDYSELKRMAEAALGFDWEFDWMEKPVSQLRRACTPAVILALIAENETIKAQFDECARLFVDATEQACKAQRERDQLKAENEALRNGSGKAADALAAARKALMVARPRTATHMELMTAALYAIDAAINQGEQA